MYVRNRFFKLLLVVIPLFFITQWAFHSVKSYHFSIPIALSAESTPYVEVYIEGKPYPMLIDLGSKFQMTLTSETLCKLTKHPKDTQSWINLKGEKYEYSHYTIPKIKIGPLTFNQIETTETPSDTDCVFWEDPKKEKLKNFVNPVGSLGKNLLTKINFLLDFEHSKIIASNQKKKIIKEGYDIDNYIKVPLEITPKVLLVHADTELGPKTFILDTGCTWSFAPATLQKEKPQSGSTHNIPFITLNNLTLGNHNFGKQNLYLITFPEEITSHKIDGLLGVDFFKKHTIYLDFPNNTAYISK